MGIWTPASLCLRQRVSQLSGIPCTFIHVRHRLHIHVIRREHKPLQPFNSLSTSQSLSVDLYKTAPTNLNRHVCGVFSPPNDTVNVATIAKFITSWYFEIFCAIVNKYLVESRGRRKPQQSPLDHAWNLDFVIQSHWRW